MRTLSAVVAALLAAPFAHAQTTWTGAASTSWSNPANWSAGVPTASVAAIIAPAANQPDTTGVIGPTCATLTIQAGAVVTTPITAPVRVNGSVSAAGSTVGELRLIGSGSISTSGGGLLDRLTIEAGPYSVTSATINDLEQLATAAAVTVQTLHSNGSVDFRGAGLVGAANSLIDGNSVTVRTTVATTVPPTSIRLKAAWNSDASWQPASGTVIFTGPNGTAATVAPGTVWANLEVESTFGLLYSGDLVVAGALRLRNDIDVSGTLVDLTQRLVITQFSELRAVAATQLRLRNGVTAAGFITTPNAVADVDGDVTFFVTGAMAIGNGTHHFSNSVGIAGGLAAPATATLVFDGSGNLTFSPISLLPNVVISGSNYSILDATIGGNLTQVPGAGNLSIFRCRVDGNCVFQGNAVVDNALGLLDANGDVTWQTASVVTNPPLVISCAGNWTANASFAPTSGLVVFDGVGTKAVTVPAFAWSSLRIAPPTHISTPLAVATTGSLEVQGQLISTGNDVESFGPLVVSGSLQANSSLRVRAHSGLVASGTIQATAARLDVDGDVSIGGTVTLGNGIHEISGSVLVTGMLVFPTGQTLVLDGAGTIDVAAASPLPNVNFAAGNYAVQSLVVSRDLQHLSGTLSVHSCTVQRDALFTGTGLVDLAGGLLDVRRNVTLQTSGTVANPPATCRCGGNWTSTATFAPTSGRVVFAGAGAQAISTASPPWFDLSIDSLSVATMAGNLTANGQVEVAGRLNVSGTGVTVAGAIDVTTGGILNATAATTIHAGSDLTLSGSLLAGSAAVVATGSIEVAATGSASLGVGPHLLSSDLTVSGVMSLPVNADFHFVGTGTIQVIGATVLPLVTFANGPYKVVSLTVAGQITQTGGRINVTSLTGHGSALFAGQSVGDDGGGLLEVAGDITFATSNVIVTPPSLIRCGGNWTSNPQFLPASGTVEMMGVAPQAMSAPQLFLASLVVDATAVVTIVPGDLVLQGDLLVDGQLTTPTNSLQVRGGLHVSSTGHLQLAGGSLTTVQVDLVNSGSITGSGVLRMVGAGLVTGSGAFASLEIAASGEIVCSATVTLSGSLVLSSGTLRLAPGALLHVLGDGQALGGFLRGSGAVLDVDGNIVLSGSVAHPAGVPDIRCAGNWTANGAFAPASGTVFLDGPGTLNSLGGTLTFAQLRISGGTRTLGNDVTAAAQDVQVLAGANLDLGARRLAVTAPTFGVPGALLVGPGGQLFLGPLTALTVPVGGILSLVGTFLSKATVDGPPGGAYTFVVDGTVEAMNFGFAHMGPSGITVTANAIIAPAPRDLRAGSFASGDPAPGACLLRIDRSSPIQLRYPDFDNAGTVTFNVRSTGAAAVRIVNDSGTFTGPVHEDDPGAKIDWLPPEHTVLTGFSSTAAEHRTDIAIATAAEVDVQRFHVLRATSAGGPFAPVVGSPVAPLGSPSLGASYGLTDLAVVDTTKYFYRLEEELLHGERRLLGADFARPWPQQVANTWFVGTNGGYPDIAAAVAAAAPGGNIAVQAGTYPAFTINKAVHISPDGSGPVHIDTSLGKMVVRDIPAGAPDLALYDLIVGSGTSAFGMEVVNCDNVVVLDSLQVTTTTGVTGLLIDDTTHIAIQNCQVVGDPGLRFDNGSVCYLSRGSVDELVLAGNSNVTKCDLTPGNETVAPGSTLRPLANVMPDMTFRSTWHGEKNVPMTITTDAGSLFAIMFSLRRDFLDLEFVYPIDMVMLIEHTQSTIVWLGFSPTGSTTVTMASPGVPGFWGLQLPLQMFELKASGLGRMSNTRDVILLP